MTIRWKSKHYVKDNYKHHVKIMCELCERLHGFNPLPDPEDRPTFVNVTRTYPLTYVQGYEQRYDNIEDWALRDQCVSADDERIKAFLEL